jgi:hypothetical protein
MAENRMRRVDGVEAARQQLLSHRHYPLSVRCPHCRHEVGRAVGDETPEALATCGHCKETFSWWVQDGELQYVFSDRRRGEQISPAPMSRERLRQAAASAS